MRVESGAFYNPWRDAIDPERFAYDRMFADDEAMHYAIFGGLGRSWASEPAVDSFARQVEDGAHFDSDMGLRKIHEDVVKTHTRIWPSHRTSAAILGLTEVEGIQVAKYAVAGDPRIYQLEHSSEQLRRVHHDDLREKGKWGEVADIRRFVGAEGFSPRIYGRFILSGSTFALVNRSLHEVYDFKGIQSGRIREVLASDLTPQGQAEALVDIGNSRNVPNYRPGRMAVVVKVEL